MACVRETCRAELPEGAVYCHACGVPQVAPCPACGFTGDTGLGFSLREGQCPQCRGFLRHCPQCRKRYPLGHAQCDNEAWNCAGTELRDVSQSYGCRAANPQRTHSSFDPTNRARPGGNDDLPWRWRLTSGSREGLSDPAVKYGRIFTVDAATHRLLSIPMWADTLEGPAFDFDATDDRVDVSDELGFPNDPVVRDLEVREGYVCLVARPRARVGLDGSIEPPKGGTAYLLEASTLRVVRQSRARAAIATHLAADRWLTVLASEARSGRDGFDYVLVSPSDERVIREDHVDAELAVDVPIVDCGGRAYVATSTGLVEIALDDGAHRTLEMERGERDVRGVVAVEDDVFVLAADESAGRFELHSVDRSTSSRRLLLSAVPTGSVSGPPVAAERTLYLHDPEDGILRAYAAEQGNCFRMQDQDIRTRTPGRVRTLHLVRSSSALHIVCQADHEGDATAFEVEEAWPDPRGSLGRYRIRSDDASFAYADGRLFVSDRGHGTLEALEVFPS